MKEEGRLGTDYVHGTDTSLKGYSTSDGPWILSRRVPPASPPVGIEDVSDTVLVYTSGVVGEGVRGV